jgi:hypothetical protein
MSGGAASWPEELGHPASTGAQNDMRYGVFPESRRLAVEMGGRMAVYDTGDHRITGVSQQQGGDRSLTFTSQHGLVRASDLRRIEIEADEDSPAPTGDVADIPKAMADVLPSVPGPINPVDTPSPEPRKKPAPDAKTPPKAATGGDDIIALIQKLADLKANGILTEAEFEAKKTELLSRL